MAKKTAKTAKASRNQKLIDALNEDLNLEFQAIARYILYAATAQGPYRPAISELFRTETTDEMLHANQLADKIAALGGTPHLEFRGVEPLTDPHVMLQVVLDAEDQAIATYRRHLRMAESAGDVALRMLYENLILDETKHAEEIKKILADWR